MGRFGAERLPPAGREAGNVRVSLPLCSSPRDPGVPDRLVAGWDSRGMTVTAPARRRSTNAQIELQRCASTSKLRLQYVWTLRRWLHVSSRRLADVSHISRVSLASWPAQTWDTRRIRHTPCSSDGTLGELEHRGVCRGRLWAVEGRPGWTDNDQGQPPVCRSAAGKRAAPQVAISVDQFLRNKRQESGPPNAAVHHERPRSSLGCSALITACARGSRGAWDSSDEKAPPMAPAAGRRLCARQVLSLTVAKVVARSR